MFAPEDTKTPKAMIQGLLYFVYMSIIVNTFDPRPAHTAELRGLLIYHITKVSTAERRFMQSDMQN